MAARDKEAEGELPADKVELAHRAAAGGPVPDDEEVRAAAFRIASQRLADYAERTRRLSVVVTALLLIGCVVGAVTETPWALLGGLAPAAVLYSVWFFPRQLRRRIRLLGGLSEYDVRRP